MLWSSLPSPCCRTSFAGGTRRVQISADNFSSLIPREAPHIESFTSRPSWQPCNHFCGHLQESRWWKILFIRLEFLSDDNTELFLPARLNFWSPVTSASLNLASSFLKVSSSSGLHCRHSSCNVMCPEGAVSLQCCIFTVIFISYRHGRSPRQIRRI